MGIIIGLAGGIASGKGTVARFFSEKPDFKVISTGDILRRSLRQQGNETINRVFLQEYGRNVDLVEGIVQNAIRKYFPGGYISGNYVFDALRSTQQVRNLHDYARKNEADFYLLRIFAGEDIRKERFERRSSKTNSFDSGLSFVMVDRHDMSSLQGTREVLFNRFEDVNVVDLDNDGPESQLITALESFYRGIKPVWTSRKVS